MEAVVERLGTFGIWLQAHGASSMGLVQHLIGEKITSTSLLAQAAASLDEVRGWAAGERFTAEEEAILIRLWSLASSKRRRKFEEEEKDLITHRTPKASQHGNMSTLILEGSLSEVGQGVKVVAQYHHCVLLRQMAKCRNNWTSLHFFVKLDLHPT